MDYSIQKLSTADIALATQLIQLWNEQDSIADPPEPSDQYRRPVVLFIVKASKK
jgi:hypothetical protein